MAQFAIDRIAGISRSGSDTNFRELALVDNSLVQVLREREQRIAKQSSERMLRTKIEQLNHRYLLTFVEQFQACFNSERKDAGDQTSFQGKEDIQSRVSHVWAEQFYTRLDELLVQVQKKCAGDDAAVFACYEQEIKAFYESKRQFWAKTLSPLL